MTENKRIVLIEYFTTDESILIFGVRADWDEPRVVEIHKSIETFRHFAAQYFSLQYNDSDPFSSTGDKVKQLDLVAWQDALGDLIAPIIQWTNPGDYVYLVPHDVLHYLPLHALKVNGGYLVERNPVAYTPSASVLKYCQHNRREIHNGKALVVAHSPTRDPLPNVTEEALEIAHLYQTEPHVDDKVTRSWVLETLREQHEPLEILHFACHGYFHRTQPLKSGLVLAVEKQADLENNSLLFGYSENQIITAEDFFGLPPLQVSLVTLSACDTGVSDIKPGDELFGLMRALIYAGTPSIVMSLWSVDDVSTEIFMIAFYQQLQQGQTKINALNHAQNYIRTCLGRDVLAYLDQKQAHVPPNDLSRLRKLLSLYQKYRTRIERQIGLDTPIFEHPYYWASFVLIGDWR